MKIYILDDSSLNIFHGKTTSHHMLWRDKIKQFRIYWARLARQQILHFLNENLTSELLEYTEILCHFPIIHPVHLKIVCRISLYYILVGALLKWHLGWSLTDIW